MICLKGHGSRPLCADTFDLPATPRNMRNAWHTVLRGNQNGSGRKAVAEFIAGLPVFTHILSFDAGDTCRSSCRTFLP